MNIDIIRESITMPLLERGNHLVVHKVGAYNMTQWMQFITLRPNIVLIDSDNNTHVIRKAETLEYLELNERVPDHLKNNQLK
jgi:diaminopimelate decarboxylase